MVRQKLDALDFPAVLAQVFAEFFGVFALRGNTVYENAAYPNALVFFAKVVEKPPRLFVIPARKFDMSAGIDVFDIEQKHIGKFDNFGDAPRDVGVAAGIDGGVNAARFQKSQKFGEEVGLDKWFAARDSDAAARHFKERGIFFDFRKNFGSGHRGLCARSPSIWIVAETAAQRAPVQKEHEAQPGTINSPSRLKRMYLGVHSSAGGFLGL